MSDHTKIVSTPAENGTDKKAVRSNLLKEFPDFRVASILHDEEGERWVAQLVKRTDRVHHKVAEDGKPPFPLKELGPEDDEKDDDSSDDTSDDDTSDDEKPTDEEKPKDDDGGDVKTELAGLLKQFKKLLPALEKVVGPVDDEEGPPKDAEDIGPVPGGPDLAGGGPPPPRPGGPPGMGGPPAPRAPGIPGGRPGRPPVRPSVGVPTFTKRQSVPLQRQADVSEEQARAELVAAYPDYEIAEFKTAGGLYLVRLEQK